MTESVRTRKAPSRKNYSTDQLLNKLNPTYTKHYTMTREMDDISVKYSEISAFSIAKTLKRKSFVITTGSCSSTKTRTFKKVN